MHKRAAGKERDWKKYRKRNNEILIKKKSTTHNARTKKIPVPLVSRVDPKEEEKKSEWACDV